jgi:hypothetical protein
MAVPDRLVSDRMFMPPDNKYLPFLRIEKVPNHYTLPSQVVEISRMMRGDKPVYIPEHSVSLAGFTLWEAPVYPDSDYYHPICDMELISKIADFNDPRRVFLDYWHRTGYLLTGLKTKDCRGEAAANFIAEASGLHSLKFHTATWYTRVPLPLCPELTKFLAKHLPGDHEKVIVNWWARQGEVEDLDIPEADLPLSFIGKHQRENKRFWKEKTKSKTKAELKLYGKGAKEFVKNRKGEEPINQLNMDDIARVWEDYKQDFHSRVAVADYPEPVAVMRYDYKSVPRERPAWVDQLVETQEDEYEFHSEASDDDDSYEAYLVRCALDQIEDDQADDSNFFADD